MSNWSASTEPVRVLGITLREPITLAHVLLLAEEDCPLVTGGDAYIGDVAFAVFVCAFPADKARRKIRSRLAGLTFRLWQWLCPIKDDAQKFHDWLDAQVSLPQRWIEQGRGGTSELAAPWWINRIALAMSAGLSYTEAVSMPLPLVNLIVAAHLEARGAANFVSRRQSEFFEQIKQWEAAKRN